MNKTAKLTTKNNKNRSGGGVEASWLRKLAFISFFGYNDPVGRNLPLVSYCEFEKVHFSILYQIEGLLFSVLLHHVHHRGRFVLAQCTVGAHAPVCARVRSGPQ